MQSPMKNAVALRGCRTKKAPPRVTHLKTVSAVFPRSSFAGVEMSTQPPAAGRELQARLPDSPVPKVDGA